MNKPMRYFKLVKLVIGDDTLQAMVTQYNPDTNQFCVYTICAPKYGGMVEHWLDADAVIAAIASDGRVVA